MGCTWSESSNNARHQVANDDQVTDGHAETLDGNGGIEQNGEVWIGELGQGSKRHGPTIHVSCASCLEVESKARRDACPCDDEDAEEDAHFGEGRGHGEEAGAEDCLLSAFCRTC